uniref:Uncharacterized protein n=1 Tax=Panagrolaimus superbus TaxID=310955 RepID=A0A914YNK0_9BILA
MQDDCNDHFPELLTTNEVPEYIKILNGKRAVLDLPALDENDYLDNDDNDDEEKENENKTPVSQIVLPVHESFDIIYFLRFVKHFNEKTEENQLGIQFYRPLFDDFLNFIDDKITTEMYDDEME